MRRLLLLLCIFMTACSNSSLQPGQAQASSSETLLVGALLNGEPEADSDTQAAVRLAVDDVNAYLTAAGSSRRVSLQVENCGLDPDRAVAGLARLQEAGAVVVVGPESSGELEALLAPSAGRTVLVSHCSTASSLARADNVFRLVPSDASQTGVLAQRIADSGATGVVIVHRDDVFGNDLTAGLRARLTVPVVGELAYDDQNADYPALAMQLRDLVVAHPGSVVQLSAFGPDGADLLEACAAFPELAAVRWFGSDGTAKSPQIAENPAAAGFAEATAFESPLFGVPQNARTAALSARVAAASGVAEPQVCSLTAYDGVWLAVLSQLPSDGQVGSLVASFPTVAEGFFGASGWTELDDAGDRQGGVYDLWVLRQAIWVVGGRV